MKKIILIAVVATAIISCSKRKVKSDDIVISEEMNMEHRPLNFETSRRENNAHSGQYYSSTDSINQFGIGYEYVLNDSLKKNNLKVYITCWVREAKLPIEGKISIGLSNAKELKKWNAFGVKDGSYKGGDWVQIIDSIVYPAADLQDEFIKVGVVATKNAGSDSFDVDDLKLSYKFYK